MECPVVDSRVPVSVASANPSDVGTQRKVGNGDSQLAPLEVISSLVTSLGSSSGVLAVRGAERGHTVMEWA